MVSDQSIPYGRQQLDEKDIAAVIETLRSNWLTTGPGVQQFEKAVAGYLGIRCAVAVNSGTAALHTAMHAAGIGPGDEVIIPAMTFAATANAVLYCGGTPVFCDVESSTLLLDTDAVEAHIGARTKAIIAVDYAGQPCNYQALRALADHHGLMLIADACHSFGARFQGRPCGTQADLSVFSFHPVKPITTGEGGMIVTDQQRWDNSMRRFRNHGIDTDHHGRQAQSEWQYDQVGLGFNYRITDMQCALGLTQLQKLDEFIARRQQLAAIYDQAFSEDTAIVPLGRNENTSHGYHLYVVRIPQRQRIFRELREAGIGVNVHYRPVYQHSYYRQRFGAQDGRCPVAEQAAQEILTLPIYPDLTEAQQLRVIEALKSRL